MRRAAVVVLLVCAVPAAAAVNTGTIAMHDGFSSLAMHAFAEAPRDAARSFREAADHDGDAQVTQDEADAFMAAVRPDSEHRGRESLKTSMRLDDAFPTDASVSTAIAGLVGPVATTAPLTASLNATVTFAPGTGPTHTLRMTGSPVSGADSSAITFTLTAPSGFVIASQEGLKQAAFAPDRHSVTFVDDSQGNATIEFAPAGAQSAQPSPPFGILPGLAAILVGAFLARGKPGAAD
ncbi:MAG: hypothetical protein V4510_03240 [bacterium]